MPATALTVAQFGQESAWGTAVAATAKLQGFLSGTIQPDAQQEQVEELGRLYPSALTALTGLSAQAQIEQAVTYEDILFPLYAAFGDVTPTGTNPYTYTFSAPTTTAPTLQPLSLEYGTADGQYVLAGAFASKLTLKLTAAGLWMANYDLLGKSIAAVSLAALSDRTVELARASDTTLHIDAAGGTIGTTAVATTLIDAELTVETNRHLKTFAGALAPSTYGESRWGGTLKLTLEWNSTVKGYFDAALSALVSKLIQVKASSGSKSLSIQFAGYLESSVELFRDRDGNQIVEMTFRGRYDSVFANWLKVIAINAVSTLP